MQNSCFALFYPILLQFLFIKMGTGKGLNNSSIQKVRHLDYVACIFLLIGLCEGFSVDSLSEAPEKNPW